MLVFDTGTVLPVTILDVTVTRVYVQSYYITMRDVLHKLEYHNEYSPWWDSSIFSLRSLVTPTYVWIIPVLSDFSN